MLFAVFSSHAHGREKSVVKQSVSTTTLLSVQRSAPSGSSFDTSCGQTRISGVPSMSRNVATYLSVLFSAWSLDIRDENSSSSDSIAWKKSFPRRPANSRDINGSITISPIEISYPAVRARMRIFFATSYPERSSQGFGSVYFFACASTTIEENESHRSSSEQIYASVPEKHPWIEWTVFLVS